MDINKNSASISLSVCPLVGPTCQPKAPKTYVKLDSTVDDFFSFVIAPYSFSLFAERT